MSGGGGWINVDAWREVASGDEGTLPDGVVAGTGREAWDSVLAAIHDRGWAIAPDSDDQMLVLRARPGDGVLINIWRFGWESIDFDFDLRELQTQVTLDRFCDFVRMVGRVAERDVVLNPEGATESGAPYAVYRHVEDRFEVRS